MDLKKILSQEQIDELVSGLDPIFESETTLIGTTVVFRKRYEVQITITRNHDDFMGNY